MEGGEICSDRGYESGFRHFDTAAQYVKPEKWYMPYSECLVPFNLKGVWAAMEEAHRLGPTKSIGVEMNIAMQQKNLREYRKEKANEQQSVFQIPSKTLDRSSRFCNYLRKSTTVTSLSRIMIHDRLHVDQTALDDFLGKVFPVNFIDDSTNAIKNSGY
ncbi:hypothetical protein VNO80_10394 [Phaseolus coccineus]|uniref:Uncharacterized protein n=1 Tax=Phaseolus coccineus TaxID=3886 RepID=A0AAN9N819_PHACN